LGRPAYSKGLVEVTDLTGPNLVYGTTDNQVLVVREASATIGGYLGNPEAALGLGPDGPWSWVMNPGVGHYFNTEHASFTWEGRFVVNPSSELWINTSDGDYFDFLMSGYLLSADGS
jgi:hypothetical protein